MDAKTVHIILTNQNLSSKKKFFIIFELIKSELNESFIIPFKNKCEQQIQSEILYILDKYLNSKKITPTWIKNRLNFLKTNLLNQGVIYYRQYIELPLDNESFFCINSSYPTCSSVGNNLFKLKNKSRGWQQKTKERFKKIVGETSHFFDSLKTKNNKKSKKTVLPLKEKGKFKQLTFFDCLSASL